MIDNIALVPDAAAVPLRTVRLSWGGLFGGIAVAVGAWLLLTALGLAVGLSSFDPNDPMASVGFGAGIWSIIVSIIALFLGGLVASRTSGIPDRVIGVIHGAVIWSLATILSVLLVASAVRGVVRTAGAAAGTAAGAAATTGVGLSQALGIDANDAIGPINERLRAEGKPTVTPAQVQAVVQSTVSAGVREGRIDKETLVRSISGNTALSPADARDFANRIEAQVNARAGAVGQEAKSTASKAADVMGKAMWWAFLGMLLGLASAVIGATLGVGRRRGRGIGIEPRSSGPTREVRP